LITVGQIDHFLGEVRLPVPGDHGRVGNHIIHVLGAHGAGIAEVVDLDRSTSLGKDARPCIRGVALQVDGNVDAQLSGAARNLTVALVPDIDEFVKSRSHPLAHFILFVRTEGKPVQLELVCVVSFEQLCHQIGSSVVVEICRIVGKADFSGTGSRAYAAQGITCRIFCAGINHGNLLMQLGCIDQAQRRERCRNFFAAPDIRLERAQTFGQALPVAQLHPGMQQRAGQEFVVGLERQGLFVAGQRFVRSLEVSERIATIVVRLRDAGTEGQGLIVAGQCFVRPLELAQRITAVVIRLRVFGF